MVLEKELRYAVRSQRRDWEARLRDYKLRQAESDTDLLSTNPGKSV